jgi:hypothetical protein
MGANTDPTQAAPNGLAVDIGALIADTKREGSLRNSGGKTACDGVKEMRI